MATKPARRCTKCGAIVRGRCESCSKTAGKRYDQQRGSAHARGYDRTWQQFRAYYLAANPLCVDCEGRGATTAATEVHHVEKVADAPDRRLDEMNVLGLCKACHSRRTAKGE